MEIEFNELGFHVQKPSSMNSFSIHGKRVHWTHFPWTQLPWVCFRTVLIRCLYFIELSSYGFAWSSSAEDRWLRLQIVQRTRFLYMENEFTFSMNSAPICFRTVLIKCLYQIVLRALDCWQTSSLNSAHMGLLDRLVQKIVGCVCKSCNFLWRKTSSKNSFSIHGKQVHWTRFLNMETEFIELDFHVFSPSVFPKLSPLNSNCYKRN